MGILVALYFLRRTARKGGFLSGGYDLNRNYGMVVILLSFLCNYDNLTLQLYQKNGVTLIGRFKVGSVPGMSVALEASKKVSKSIMSMMQGY